MSRSDDDPDRAWSRELEFRRQRNELRDPRDPAFEEDMAEPGEDEEAS